MAVNHDLRERMKQRIGKEHWFGRFLAAASRSPQARRDRASREAIKKKKHMRWWLVYGAARTGTTYMIDMIASCSRLWISDWCLDSILKLVPDYDYIKFDKNRALKDISENILDSAYRGKGDQLDFAVKEAELEFEEYQMFVKMWGPPSRIIYCFRQPAGYINSAEKHFTGPYATLLSRLQENYVRLFDIYEKIGGDVFEYTPDLTMDHYLLFLKPLKINREMNKEFVYKGTDKNEYTTDAMWTAYHHFKNSHVEGEK